MQIIWLIIVGGILYGLWTAIQIFVNQKHGSPWREMHQDLLTLADILNYGNTARQRIAAVTHLPNIPENEMTFRLAFHYLAIDLFTLLDPKYAILKREAKEIPTLLLCARSSAPW